MTQWQALLFSIAIEVPVVYLLVTRKNWLRLPYWPYFLVTSLSATLLTHPLLWHTYVFILPIAGEISTTLLLEGLVVLAEQQVYRHLGKLDSRQALWTSLIANMASFSVGFLVL